MGRSQQRLPPQSPRSSLLALPWCLCPRNRHGCWWLWHRAASSSSLQGMNETTLQAIKQESTEGVTVSVIITFRSWVIWVDGLGCPSSPTMVITLLSPNHCAFTKVRRWGKPSNAMLMSVQRLSLLTWSSPTLVKQSQRLSDMDSLTRWVRKQAWIKSGGNEWGPTSWIFRSYTRWASIQRTTLALSESSFVLVRTLWIIQKRARELKLREYCLRTIGSI